jgi:predicted HicB family RNase H-like nuclease
MARPRKADDQLYDKDVRLRMRSQDVELITKAAGESGLSLSSWVRDRLTSIARAELRDKGDV